MILDEVTKLQLDMVGRRDHSISSEYRIYGPPGTGKTTNTSMLIRRAIEGEGPDSVLVTGFSRATAAELAGRDIPLSPDRIGTLHSHCFHALGNPTIAEGEVREWNRQYPRLKLTSNTMENQVESDDPITDDLNAVKPGDRLLHEMNICRGTLMDPNEWPGDVLAFAVEWNAYKQANGLVDFTDLIEIVLQNFDTAPGNPSVVVADEAQDLNRLQLTLLRRWGTRSKYLILAGDDDQTIYEWAGASPDALLDVVIPDDHKIFLEQSMRVPWAVHLVAENLIRKVTKREPKTYRPRAADGAVHRLSRGDYRSPEYLILKSLDAHLNKGQTVMFLASCAYMLRPITAVLRRNGIPFHNPLRKTNPLWNPLRAAGRRSAMSRMKFLLSYTAGQDGPSWRPMALASWTDWLLPHVIKSDGAALVSGFPNVKSVGLETLQALLEEKIFAQLLNAFHHGDAALVKWWQSNLKPEFRKRVEFPALVASVAGAAALNDLPQVVVGTIHSVKGGQADVVYLFPDLSKNASLHYGNHGRSRDSILRLYYVGVTRAREELYICSPAGPMAIWL